MKLRALIFLITLLLSATQISAQSAAMKIEIGRQRAIGDKVMFELYLSSSDGTPQYLAHTGIVILYDSNAFNQPEMTYDKTYINLYNENGLKLNNLGMTYTILSGDNKGKIMINFQPGWLADGNEEAEVRTKVARIDGREKFHCLGLFTVSGFNNTVADPKFSIYNPIVPRHGSDFLTKVYRFNSDATSSTGPVDGGSAGGNFLFVTLTAFTAVTVGRSAELEWTTQNEVNMTRFEIERSIDNVSFVKIGDVAAKGFQNQLSVYRSIDRDVFNPNDQITLFYYRLKYITDSDSFAYSPTRAVTFNELNEIDMNTWPNPATDIVNIQLKNIVDETIVVRLLDRQGSEISSRRFSPNEIIRFEVAGIAPGIYLLEVTTTKGKRTEKVVVWR